MLSFTWEWIFDAQTWGRPCETSSRDLGLRHGLGDYGEGRADEKSGSACLSLCGEQWEFHPASLSHSFALQTFSSSESHCLSNCVGQGVCHKCLWPSVQGHTQHSLKAVSCFAYFQNSPQGVRELPVCLHGQNQGSQGWVAKQDVTLSSLGFRYPNKMSSASLWDYGDCPVLC